jgi:hypothetical protein
VATPPPGVALNISTRLPVLAGDNALIDGFIIVGPTPKRVLIRATGPSIPLAGVLQDPVLELHDSATGAVLATNDNWRTTQIGGAITSSQVIDILATTIPPSNDLESAIIATLNPNQNYTAISRSANNAPGIGVVEVYDLDPVRNSTLANISTRGFVQTDDNVMFAGLFYGGGVGGANVVVRGIGPSLVASGISNPLQDPILEVHNANGGLVDQNDNWQQSPQAAAIQADGLAPKNSAESAVLLTRLARGSYTAILRGQNRGTGVGLVEVYIFP